MTKLGKLKKALAIREYTVGYLLALLLTAIPFALTMANEGLNTERTSVLSFIGILSLIQIFVHLKFFLHLHIKKSPTENFAASVFALTLMFIMVGGTIWIILNLNNRMMS